MEDRAEKFLKQNSGQPASFVAEYITVANAREYAKLYASEAPGGHKSFSVAMLEWMLEERYKSFNANNSGHWSWLAGGSSVAEWPERVYDNFVAHRISEVVNRAENIPPAPAKPSGVADFKDLLIEHLAAKTFQPAVENGMATMNKVMAGDWVQWDHYYGLVKAVELMQAQIKTLKERLELDKPNPFHDGYDAIDLLNDRIKIMSSERTVLAIEFSDWTNDLNECDYYPVYDMTVSYGKCLGWQSRSDDNKCITTGELFEIFTEYKQKNNK